MFRSILLAAVALMVGAGAAAAAPKVVVSLPPLHGLATAVMEGVAEPSLILGAGASPHTATLKPSQAQALAEADLVFWVGPSFELFLVDPVETLAEKARHLEAEEVEGIALLPTREGGVWEAHGDEHDDEEHAEEDDHDHERAEEDHEDEHEEHAEEGHGHDHDGAFDGHLWLDPANAVLLTRALVTELSEIDPENAERYATNGAKLEADIEALDAELKQKLAPVADVPFIVFHDAYQYFESHYRLAGVGSITVSPDLAPGAQRLQAIRQKIEGLGAVCVFAEPQFEPRLVQTVIGGTSARTGVLDPEGATIPPGPDAYQALMRTLAENLVDCLSPAT